MRGFPSSFPQDENIFVFEFENEDLEDFTRSLWEAEKSPEVHNIFVWVSSYGGLVHNMYAMIDSLKFVKKPVYMIGYGKAMSAGAMLLITGQKGNRIATPNTSIMIHTASSGVFGKTQDIQEEAMQMGKIHDNFIDLLAENSKKTKAYWKKLFKEKHNADITLSAQEALNLGLIDHIGFPASFQQQAPSVGVLKIKE